MGNCLWISIASFRPHLCKNGKVKRNHSRNGIWHTTCCRLQSLTVQSISKFFPHPSTRRWTLILCTRLDSTITGILLRTGLRCLFFFKKKEGTTLKGIPPNICMKYSNHHRRPKKSPFLTKYCTYFIWAQAEEIPYLQTGLLPHQPPTHPLDAGGKMLFPPPFLPVWTVLSFFLGVTPCVGLYQSVCEQWNP